MAAVNYLTIDDTALELFPLFVGTQIPDALADSTYGARVHVHPDSPYYNQFDDGWSAGKYIGSSIKHGRRAFTFQWTNTAVVYTRTLGFDEILKVEFINVDEGG